jgi:hypothetical protein
VVGEIAALNGRHLLVLSVSQFALDLTHFSEWLCSGFEFSVNTSDAGAVRPAKPPARLGQPPLAEPLFYSAIGDREGVYQLPR